MEQLWEYVRGVMWDHEEVPDNVGFVERPEIWMYRTEGSSSILSNKVVKVSAESEEVFLALFREIQAFYQEKPFSWWIGPDSSPEDLVLKVQSLGLVQEDTYYGLVKAVGRWEKVNLPYTVRSVVDEQDVRHYVDVAAKIWGYEDRTKEMLVRQRLEYLRDSKSRGGFLIVMDEEHPVAYAGYRFSGDGEAAYLAGTGVLSEYRRQGIYRALLAKRMELASSYGSNWLVTQARKGTSEPILRKLGFEDSGKYEVYKRS
ncbi:GNAT family N-acetyltransferase [Pseudalkalibacillus salsuginis]|uniref:GNAT family N-acetyltransferase n=1 Tax=Pseudalkalibacillus salsuginis TaxID=2910972 RepID=UPI001F17B8B9|nr:GNAT family N-acetyltransferase [Pseudalkalibacillus salsuginis]MCF6410971.1 GNAT family N-acetyltransferase [Pseudalkalibacillus salsuginis]